MTGSASPDWPAVRRSYVDGDEPVSAIASRHGLTARRIYAHARAEGWPRRSDRKAAPPAPSPVKTNRPAAPPAKAPKSRKQAKRPGNTLKARRTLVRRLYSAIDTKLKQMEQRMAEDLEAGTNTATTAADHERDARSIAALISSLTRVTELEAGLDTSSGTRADTAADHLLAEEAERFRRDVAERLARLVPPAG